MRFFEMFMQYAHVGSYDIVENHTTGFDCPARSAYQDNCTIGSVKLTMGRGRCGVGGSFAFLECHGMSTYVE